MLYHVDTHVHVYHCYEPEDFLAQALTNSATLEGNSSLILCLTESRGFEFFQELKNRVSTNTAIAGWSITEIPNHPAIQLQKSDQIIIFIAGNQVITKQGLEVLALFNDCAYEDGQDVQNTIDEINNNGGLAVLPWGVGKWLGKRGKIITALINSNSPEKLAIADISARPALWPRPEQFKLAYTSGFSCLYGTDPLPIKYDQARIACAGMVMDLSSDTTLALSELKASLLNQSDNKTFENRVSTFRFVKDQLMLRLNKQSCLSATHQA